MDWDGDPLLNPINDLTSTTAYIPIRLGHEERRLHEPLMAQSAQNTNIVQLSALQQFSKPYLHTSDSGSAPVSLSQSATLSVLAQARARYHYRPQHTPKYLLHTDRMNHEQPFAQGNSLSRPQFVKRSRHSPAVSESSSDQSSQSSFNSLFFPPSLPGSETNTSLSDTPSPQPEFLSINPRLQVSSLLVDNASRSYHLEVVQHPQKTAEFGGAHSLSRLPLTPPLIARLTVRDQAGNFVFPEAELPFLVAHLALLTGDGSGALDMGVPPSGQGTVPPRRLLYGNLVSSAYKLEDLQGNLGLFFIFSDVSVRWRGQYQLGITLMGLSRVDSSGAVSIADHGTVLAQARTHAFEVVPHRDYTAAPQTRLTQCFVRQGVRITNFMSNF